MKLSYFHVAKDVPMSFKADAAVVIDVLRATTTIACALKNGAEAIQTFSDVNTLKIQSSQWPESLRILLGERGGNRLEGFDLGNSPNDVTADVVKGKRLFMSTTNGTKALERVRDVPTLYAMALINRSAVADRLILDNPENLMILGSGWEGAYSLEDSLAAGALAAYLLEFSNLPPEISNDEMNAALALWSYWKDDIVGCLRTATHGLRLDQLGNHDDDFLCCSNLDKICVVPAQTELGVIQAI